VIFDPRQVLSLVGEWERAGEEEAATLAATNHHCQTIAHYKETLTNQRKKVAGRLGHIGSLLRHMP
jgi:hypothetical protein